MAAAKSTLSLHGLKVVKRRLACPPRRGQVSSDALTNTLKGLDVTIPPVAYPKGAVLFMQGQTARGAFAVCSGQVKLLTSSLEGKTIILTIAEAGELIGLPETLSGKPYEVTAEVSQPAHVKFHPSRRFSALPADEPGSCCSGGSTLDGQPLRWI